MARAHGAKSLAQEIDPFRESIRPPVEEIDREKETAPGNEIGPVRGHRRTIDWTVKLARTTRLVIRVANDEYRRLTPQPILHRARSISDPRRMG